MYMVVLKISEWCWHIDMFFVLYQGGAFLRGGVLLGDGYMKHMSLPLTVTPSSVGKSEFCCTIQYCQGCDL